MNGSQLYKSYCLINVKHEIDYVSFIFRGLTVVITPKGKTSTVHWTSSGGAAAGVIPDRHSADMGYHSHTIHGNFNYRLYTS